MTKSLTFILLSFHTLCCMGGNTITTAKQPTLDDLDKVISASKEYTKKYEQEVGMLKIKYVHAKSAQDKLAASRDLFTKYKSFKLDSAYAYAERKLYYAKILHNYEDSVYSELDIADIFNKTGNLWSRIRFCLGWNINRCLSICVNIILVCMEIFTKVFVKLPLRLISVRRMSGEGLCFGIR